MAVLRPAVGVDAARAPARHRRLPGGYEDRLRAIAEAQRELAAAEIRDGSAMRVVCERVSELTEAEGAALLLVEGDRLRQHAHFGLCSLVDGETIPLDSSLGGWAFRANETALCNDTQTDSRIAPIVRPRLGEIRSLLAIPLRRREEPVGCLMVVKRPPYSFDKEDVYTGELLTVFLAASLAQASEVDTLARFEATYHEAPTGIFMIGLDGRTFDWNDAAAELLGYGELELTGLPFIQTVHPEQRADVAETLARVIAGDDDRFRGEVKLVARDGSVVWGNIAISTVRGPSGGARFAIAMAEDVTQRKLAEEQLRQAQKMDAIGQLTAGIAHDFNNLLMGVIGYTELLRAKAEPGTTAASHLDRIDQSAKRAARLTQQMLAFGRQQTLQPRELDLNEHLLEGVEVLSRVLGEHIAIGVSLAPNLAHVRADPTQIHQVLLNLALNARDAMPRGGELRISSANADGLVRLTVADNGCGMKPEVRERIFDPFFTTKDVGAGSGLGLASVYGIIKQSGGEITVESEPDAGSTFTIHLPALAG